MWKNVWFLFVTSFVAISCYGQTSFVVGKDNMMTGFITHQYLYDLSFQDSFKIKLIDSVLILASKDSLVVQELNHPIGDATVLSTVTMLNKQKKPIKIMEYRGAALQMSKEWTYDGSGEHPTQYVEENKVRNTVRKEIYSSSSDKINGDLVIEVTAYNGEKVDYYSREYYDKSNRKYKEVRLNDNKKDVMHTENYIYNDAGKLVSRSVYFKEFNVTKTFKEPESTGPAKCFKNFPLVLKDRVSYANRTPLTTTFLKSNQALIMDKDCKEFEYSFKSFNCEMQVKSTKTAGAKQLKVTVRERI